MLAKTKIMTSAAAAALAALGLVGCTREEDANASAEPPASPAPAPPEPAPKPRGDELARAAGPGAELKSFTPSSVMITATLSKADRKDLAVEQDAAYVGETAVLAKRLAQAVQDGAGDLPQGAATLDLLVLRPDVDRLGAPDAHSFMTLQFAVANLKAARIKTLGAFGVLNLATAVQVILPWQLAVKPWCDTHVSAPNFCLLARGSVAPELWDAQT